MRERLFTTVPLTIIGSWMSARWPASWSNQSLVPAQQVASRISRLAPQRGRAKRVAFLGLALLGCQPIRGPHPADPRQTIAAYQRALTQDSPQTAYALLTPETQAALTRDRFVTLWGATAVERAEQREQLAAMSNSSASRSGSPLIPRLGLSLASDGLVRSELRLVADPRGTWRIAAPELTPVATATPEAAVRTLLDAIDGRNLGLLLRLLSAPTRQAVEEELQERAERLRAALAKGISTTVEPVPPTEPKRQPPGSATPGSSPTTGATAPVPRIEVTGDRARLQYDPRFFIELIREKDGWRIRDMN